MPQFAFSAKDRLGNTVKGTIEADTMALAASRVGEMGYTVLEVKMADGIQEEVPSSPLASLSSPAAVPSPFPASAVTSSGPVTPATGGMASSIGKSSSAAETILPSAPAAFPTPQSAAPEPTQAFPGAPAPAAPVPASDPLADAARRRQVEAELARLGMSPEEVRRFINADPNSVEPQGKAPATPTSLPKPSSSRGSRPSADSLETFTAGLAASVTGARQQAIDKAAAQLPPFRESSVQEVRQAEALLREASMLRRREKFREAEAKCREAITLVPGDAAGLELLGDLLQGVARIDESLAAYKRALEADPKRTSAERKYGDLLMRQEQWSGYDPEAVPKKPFIAVLLSALFPGAGQFYNGDIAKGVFFLVMDVLCTYLLAWSPWGFQGEHQHGGISTSLMACVFLTAIVYIAGVIDANISARRARGASGWEV